MTTISRDDLLDAYERGKVAGRCEVLDHSTGDGDELTLADVYEQFNVTGPSDVLTLKKHTPAELLRVFLDAADQGQYVFRTVHSDGWTMSVLTSHGTVLFSQDAQGKAHMHVPSPPIGTGTLDLRVQILKTQESYRQKDGWHLETGAQFGRWL